MTVHKTNPKFEHIVQAIAHGSKLRRAWPLAGGISAGMTALEIEHPDGQSQRLIVRRPNEGVLKHRPRAAEHEFRLLQVLQTEGLAAPRPVHLDQSGSILPTPFLVVEYVEGEMDFNPTDRAGCARQLATHLAQIHSIDIKKLGLSFLRQRAGGCPETLGPRPAETDESLHEGQIRETLASLWPLPLRNAPALLHGDYWPGNVLWREGQLAAVIDWEDAGRGDPLVDLAISRLDIAWILGIEAMHAFTQHYRSAMAIDYSYLPYWDLCAALRLVRLAGPHLAEWAAFFAPYGRPDITAQTIRADYDTFVAQALKLATA